MYRDGLDPLCRPSASTCLASGIVPSPALIHIAQRSCGWSLNVCILCIRWEASLLPAPPHQVGMLPSQLRSLFIVILLRLTVISGADGFRV